MLSPHGQAAKPCDYQRRRREQGPWRDPVVCVPLCVVCCQRLDDFFNLDEVDAAYFTPPPTDTNDTAISVQVMPVQRHPPCSLCRR
jgi:hypothetical protein